MLFGAEGVYTLRNHGETGNCSMLAVSPATVHVLDLNVGVAIKKGRLIEMETGTIHHVSLIVSVFYSKFLAVTFNFRSTKIYLLLIILTIKLRTVAMSRVVMSTSLYLARKLKKSLDYFLKLTPDGLQYY